VRLAFELEPTDVSVDDKQVAASWRLRLEPTQTELISLTVEPRATGVSQPERSFDVVMHDLRRSYESWERACTRVWTDNELYDSLLSRGLRDLRALFQRQGEMTGFSLLDKDGDVRVLMEE
jgi:hypothetical protein